MNPADVEAIERATADAVTPERVVELDGWLVALDPGTTTRAHSATPLRHDASPAALPAIEALYHEAGYAPVFRVAEVPGLAPVAEALGRRGYAPVKPTATEVGRIEAMICAGRGAPAEVAASPAEGWGEVFMGEGFDPADGASRVATLSRARDALYGAVAEDGRYLAVGVIAFGQGWASIHGMRTRADRRGEGLAGRVLAGLAQAARARGYDRVFLQVEEPNPARSLYRRFGFTEAWTYRYWRKP